MPDYRDIERRLSEALGFARRPVAVSFRESAPAGVERFTGSEPSGCSFWRLAAAGRVFYTVPSDHYNCAIGSYTHQIPLPEARAGETEQTLAYMIEIGYLKREEVAAFPRLPRAPGVVLYAPLGDSPVDPDVALFSAPVGRIMLLQEAAQRAGMATGFPLLGRPTCMALAAALSGHFVVSVGCIGNRVYTDVGEDELYAALPGSNLEKIASEAQTIAAANAALRDYHRARRQELAAE